MALARWLEAMNYWPEMEHGVDVKSKLEAEVVAPAGESPEAQLLAELTNQLEYAIEGVRRRNRIHESLRGVSEVIGGEYGDRVIFELIQNAHDAHRDGHDGRILVKLVVTSPGRGDLYVANGGNGFDWGNVDALRNIGLSNKPIGEGIGNKGLGFRSVEVLTEDPRIYSQASAIKTDRFTGYCFRFASQKEVVERATAMSDAKTAEKVAKAFPKYLGMLPVTHQSETIREFAKLGFATCVHLPLKSEQAVDAAQKQLDVLLASPAPLLLFLDRLSRIAIEAKNCGKQLRKILSRKSLEKPVTPDGSSNRYELVSIEPGGGRYMVAKRPVQMEALLSAVADSVSQEPQLERWLEWSGEPHVGVAIPLDAKDAAPGTIYNFLPMGGGDASPLFGHVDAPFYASIDRCRAKFDLPLNAFLLDELAVTAAQAALDLRGIASRIGRNTIFDFAAWTPDQLDRIQGAWEAHGVEWDEAEIVPDASSLDNWISIYDSWVWPGNGYRLFTPGRLIKAGVENIAEPKLGDARLDRLASLIERAGADFEPSFERLADWSESIAKTLFDEKRSSKTWSTFYDELDAVFEQPRNMDELLGKPIFKARSGPLQAAPGPGDDHKPIFVRERQAGRKRDSGAAPYPPQALSQKFAFLDDDIELKPQTVANFLKAGLVQRYDVVPVLEALPSLFGDKAAPARRKAALEWTFSAWQAERTKVEQSVHKGKLWVETLGGWRPARAARFSHGWTPAGKTLSTFLAEASPLSADCREATAMLLPETPTWARSSDKGRKDWVTFLRLVGVQDGLPLLSDPDAPERGEPVYYFNHYLRNVRPAVGRNDDWKRLATAKSIENPYTPYSRNGEVWRFAGQVEHGELPYEAKLRFADLVLAHMGASGRRDLTWQIGRYERWGADQNLTSFPTPAGAFVKCATWLPVDGSEQFASPTDVWMTSDGRQKPPKFVARLREKLADRIADDDDLATLMLSNTVGLRNWADPSLSAQKLKAMAEACERVEQGDRSNFRSSYRLAWTHASGTLAQLPPKFPVAVQLHRAFRILAADKDHKHTIYVASDLNTAEARAIASVGMPILEVEEDAQIGSVVKLLRSTGGFDAQSIENGDIAIMVDGQRFSPSTSDPLLTSAGLEWLVDAVILAKDELGIQLERFISDTSIEERLRRIRLRFADDISLSVGGSASPDQLPSYAYPDDKLPTLVIASSGALGWTELMEAADPLSSLINGRLRSLLELLPRLAYRCSQSMPDDEPSDEDLAWALGCRRETVTEFRQSRQGDDTQLLDRLVPILAYCSTEADALRFAEGLDKPVRRPAIIEALAPFQKQLPMPAEKLCELVAATFNMAELRRELKLDFGRLNKALVALGREPISNEAEMRRMFAIWKADHGPSLVDRLRRYYWNAYETGQSLAEYAERRSLEFIEMPAAWVLDHEEVTSAMVRALAVKVMDGLLGEDTDRKLIPIADARRRNEKQLQRFIERAAPVVSAWCQANGRDKARWADSTLSLVSAVEAAGLLDFDLVAGAQQFQALARAGLWPNGMEQTLELDKLGLTAEDLQVEQKREAELREAEARKKRTIEFCGGALDTAANDFAEKLVALAELQMTDDAWLKRSRSKFQLAEMDSAATGGKRGKGGGGGKRQAKPNDDVKAAMGFASEYLVSRFLADKNDRYTDSCWVSCNRALAHTGHPGDDTLGYDFHVSMVERDWYYEVKSSLDDSFEFEFTQNEMRVAAEHASDGRHRYRILYVPFVFDPKRWRVMELPNPMSRQGQKLFRQIGSGATRMKFQLKQS